MRRCRKKEQISEDACLEELCRFKEMLKRDGKEVKVSPTTQEVLKGKQNKTIIYKAYPVVTREIEIMSTTQVEKALEPMWQWISYVVRRKNLDQWRHSFGK